MTGTSQESKTKSGDISEICQMYGSVRWQRVGKKNGGVGGESDGDLRGGKELSRNRVAFRLRGIKTGNQKVRGRVPPLNRDLDHDALVGESSDLYTRVSKSLDSQKRVGTKRDLNAVTIDRRSGIRQTWVASFSKRLLTTLGSKRRSHLLN